MISVLCYALAGTAKAQISTDENATTTQMEALVGGPSIAISNLTQTAGQNQQVGTFTGGTSAIGIPQGLFISSGDGNFNRSATILSAVTNNGGADADPDILAIRNNANQDTAAVTLQITPTRNTIFARFAFASEEYPDYVCQNFNDIFGLFISGGDIVGTQNIAIVPGTTSDISINSVNNGANNNGIPCTGEADNSAFYNDNPSGANFVLDGYTDVFEIVVNATPGVTYDFKMVVADAVDTSHDSAIFFEVFDSRWINDADLSLDLTASVITPVVNEPFQITATVTNDGPDEVDFFQVKDILPDGLNFVSAGGGNYVSATDLWSSSATLPAGQSVSLVLNVTAPDNSTYTSTAEIVQQFANDPDSLPDNLATAPGEDDTDTVSVGPMPVYNFSGSIFTDSGLGSGTAYDGQQNGTETGLAAVSVQLIETGTGNIIAATETSGTGAYVFGYDQAYAGQALTIKALPLNTNLLISESPGVLPGLSNTSLLDGEITFTPVAATNYADIDFGQMGLPAILEDRSVSVAANSAVTIPHSYTASGEATVTFSIRNTVQSPPGVFSETLHQDTDCSGTLEAGEPVVSTAIPVTASELVCLIIRTVAIPGAPEGAVFTYAIEADTDFTAIPLNNILINNDTVTVTSIASAELLKQVCNSSVNTCDENTGAGFTQNNTGKPGDILQYRIIFRPKGPQSVQNVDIFDSTPGYTALKATSARIVQSPPNIVCNIISPAGGGSEGYEGNIQWRCDSGTMAPTEEGIVAFDVQIAQ